MNKKRKKEDRQRTERTCIVCKKFASKGDFLRIVKNRQGEICTDSLQTLPGRGCYVCKSVDCLQKMAKTRALNRTYKCVVPESVYQSVQQQVVSLI